MKKILFYSVLLILTSWIWIQIYTAQFLDYDDNYGQLIGSFLLSLFGTLAIIILWIRKTKLLRANPFVVLLFILANNPLTIFMAVMFYADVFGVPLKN